MLFGTSWTCLFVFWFVPRKVDYFDVFVFKVCRRCSSARRRHGFLCKFVPCVLNPKCNMLIAVSLGLSSAFLLGCFQRFCGYNADLCCVLSKILAPAGSKINVSCVHCQWPPVQKWWSWRRRWGKNSFETSGLMGWPNQRPGIQHVVLRKRAPWKET